VGADGGKPSKRRIATLIVQKFICVADATQTPHPTLSRKGRGGSPKWRPAMVDNAVHGGALLYEVAYAERACIWINVLLLFFLLFDIVDPRFSQNPWRCLPKAWRKFCYARFG
jgi:hypothetical protein